MRAEEHKRVAREFIEGMNHNDRDAVRRAISDDYTFHSFLGTFKGPEEFFNGIRGLREAFPDLHLQIEQQVADEDTVVNRVRVSGTHKGEFAGIPATNKSVDTSAMALYRFRDDRIVEQWIEWNILDLLSQVGAKPVRSGDC